MTHLIDLAVEHNHTVVLAKVYQVIEFLAMNPIPQQVAKIAGQSTHVGESGTS